jgi:hypothetical protein
MFPRSTTRHTAESKTPPTWGALCPSCGCRLGGPLLRHLRPRLNTRADLDRARLGRLRHFVNYIDMEQAIVDGSDDVLS